MGGAVQPRPGTTASHSTPSLTAPLCHWPPANPTCPPTRASPVRERLSPCPIPPSRSPQPLQASIGTPQSACRSPSNLPSTRIRARIIAPVTPSPPFPCPHAVYRCPPVDSGLGAGPSLSYLSNFLGPPQIGFKPEALLPYPFNGVEVRDSDRSQARPNIVSDVLGVHCHVGFQVEHGDIGVVVIQEVAYLAGTLVPFSEVCRRLETLIRLVYEGVCKTPYGAFVGVEDADALLDCPDRPLPSRLEAMRLRVSARKAPVPQQGSRT